MERLLSILAEIERFRPRPIGRMLARPAQADRRFDEQQAVVSRHLERRPAAQGRQHARADHAIASKPGKPARPHSRGGGRLSAATAGKTGGRHAATADAGHAPPEREAWPSSAQDRQARETSVRTPPYHSFSRDFDRASDQEEGIASAGRIAGELKTLHEDLRRQCSLEHARRIRGPSRPARPDARFEPGYRGTRIRPCRRDGQNFAGNA